ncbi:MAG TPA: class I SAM-dependent methyltransferase [Clostridiales bacterium]|nr:class I SAM-dependent methyltransferase [Clostridiales bacterium]
MGRARGCGPSPGESEAAGNASRPYSEFAAIYDAVMRDVAYEMWADYIEEVCRRHGLRPETVLDVACGTGSSTLPLARRGLRAAGVDISPEMLAIARAKAEALGLEVEFVRQDMRRLRTDRLRTGPTFDLVTCLYDSINYLTDPRDIEEAFCRFHAALRPGGLLVFDVNSAKRLSQMSQTTLFMEGPDWAFIGQNSYDPAGCIWTITVTGFVRRRGELYRRFREVHRERAYSLEEVGRLLRRAGFDLLAAYKAFGFEPADEETARIYFVARRPADGSC